MNSDKYLFITDLDGTLLTTDKRVTPATAKALREFVGDGNHFAICTGRDINSARSVYCGLGLTLPGSFVIAYNGGQIYDVDKAETVYRTGIDFDTVREIYQLADEYGIYVHTYSDDYILAREEHECLEFYRRVIKTPVKFLGDKLFDFMKIPPCKVISIELHDHEQQERFRYAAEEKFKGKLDIMYSNTYYLELIPKESGKGEALKRLCKYLDIPVENSIAAGDGDNDISMIEAAGVGVAMINAPDSVKASADIITKLDNDHDGLAAIISSKGLSIV